MAKVNVRKLNYICEQFICEQFRTRNGVTKSTYDAVQNVILPLHIPITKLIHSIVVGIRSNKFSPTAKTLRI